MEKTIEIDIVNEDDLFEKYNKNKVSKDLINYIIESIPRFKKKDILKIKINNRVKESCIPFIIDGLKEEYQKSVNAHYYTNIVQTIYLLVGIIVLSISTIIEKVIFKEIVLIGGWVLIWSMVELELFSDTSGRRKRRILKKLLNSKIVENKINN